SSCLHILYFADYPSFQVECIRSDLPIIPHLRYETKDLIHSFSCKVNKNALPFPLFFVFSAKFETRFEVYGFKAYGFKARRLAD
ncbi:MAG: hypothetical protein PHH64_05615, partial [Proteiniphilum sp.]|nr:hypothetical protein [Proteiniphilum sp.]